MNKMKIILNNGKEYIGDLVNEDDNIIKIRTSPSDTIVLNKKLIKEIIR